MSVKKARDGWQVDATDGHGNRIRRRVPYKEAAVELDKLVWLSNVQGVAFKAPVNRLTLDALLQKYAARPDQSEDFRNPEDRIDRLRALVKMFGPKTLVQNINAKMFNQFRRDRKAGVYGTRVTDATINRDKSYLSRLFEWAVYTELLAENPLQGAAAGRESDPRDRVCAPEEFAAIYAAIAAHARAPLLLYYLLPFRSAEVAGLTWDQVNFEGNGAFRIPIGGSKSGRRRAIPFWYPFLRNIMAELPSRFAGGNVFLYQGKPLRTGIRSAFESARAESGLKTLRLHDLRHTAITNLRLAGVPDIDVQFASDHKSPFMQNRYTNLREDDLLRRRRWHYDPLTGLLAPHPDTELFEWEKVA